MRRFHIALAVSSVSDSVDDYSRRLRAQPTSLVLGKYAMWRTDHLNFSITELPAKAGHLRHVGFEDDEAKGFSVDYDRDNIMWELFSPQAQDRKIQELHGTRGE